MYAFLCSIWPYLVGGLIGWLLCGLLARRLRYVEARDRVVEKEVEVTVEKQVDNPAHLARISELESRIAELESASSSASAMGFAGDAVNVPEVDLDAAKAAGFKIKSDNDFTVIEGIGPKISELINEAGITSFYALGNTTVEAIQNILDEAGPNFALAVPTTWPEQAGMAANNQWDALMKWQDELDGGQ